MLPADVKFSGRGFLTVVPYIAVLYSAVLIQMPRVLGLQMDDTGASRPFNVVFWIAIAGTTLVIVFRNRHLINPHFFSTPAMLALIAYMLFATCSIAWAFNPEYATKAVVLQFLVLSCVVLPFALPIQHERISERLAICFAASTFVNAIYVLLTPASTLGHFGIYDHKQLLGMITALGIVLFMGDLFRGGILRRVMALVLIAIAIWLMFESKSKGTLAFMQLAPFLAAVLLVVGKLPRLSPALLLALVPIACTVLSIDTQEVVSRQADRFYGDPTVTGRIYIWEFIQYQIMHFPWLGWGFHSYWNVPSSPHSAAWGFVKDMVSSHSGYLELRLETGAVGHGIFLVFVYASLRGLEYVRRDSLVEAWVFLSIGIYSLLLNLFESMWLSLTPNWLVFVIVVAELNRRVAIARASQAETERLLVDGDNYQLGGRRPIGRQAIGQPRHVAFGSRR